MKKIYLVLVILGLFCSVKCFGEIDFVISLNSSENGIIIKSSTNYISLDTIIIPDSLTITTKTGPKKYPVVEIFSNAFLNCSTLKHIVLPKYLKVINTSAFKNCKSLKTITLPGSLTTIGQTAFINCTSLDSIIIPNSVISLGKQAFENCTNLKHIELPDTIKQIPDFFLYKCISLDSITIPKNCTKINKAAFARCTNLSYINFSNNIISLGDSAFKNCSNLKRVYFPDSLDSISTACFMNCSQLDSVIIPNNTRKVLMSCFENCSSLSYIKLSDKLQSNLVRTFKNTKIRELIIPTGVKMLFSSTIEGCDSLRYITMQGGPIICNCSSSFCKKPGETYIYNIINNRNYENTFIKSRFYPQYLAHKCWGISNTYVPIDSLMCNYYSVKYFTIPYSYHADTILLLQGRDASSSKFDIVEGETYYADHGIGVHFKINNQRFYYFSLPFDCAISDIKKSNHITPVYGRDFIIKKHDGERVAKYGHESTIASNSEKYGWITLNANDTLRSGRGYIVATSTPELETYYFITHDSIQLHHINSYSSKTATPLHDVEVTYYNNSSTNAAYHGWNLISSGLLYDISNHDMYVNNEKVNYISIPDSIGKKYYQSEVCEANILPYRSFLVQVSDTGIVSFRKNTSNILSESNEFENRIVLSLNNNNSQLDKTTFIISNKYSEQYEYNKDLMKFIGSDCPQIYSIYNGINLCYNALSDSSILNSISLGINIPDTTKNYSISLDKFTFDSKEYNLYLIDKDDNLNINLNEISLYNFHSSKITDNNRFEIYLAKRIELSENTNNVNNINWYICEGKLFIDNISEEATLNIYSIDGKLLYKTLYCNGIDISTLSTGIYFIKVGDNNIIKFLK